MPDRSTVELVPERLYALGGMLELDGRLSWEARDARGYKPANCYLLVGDHEALLVDTGVACQSGALLGQLAALLDPGQPLQIFLTRAEHDCSGAVGAVASTYRVTRLFAGGGTNPFDAFDFITSDLQPHGDRIQLARKDSGFSIELGADRQLTMIKPALRILNTYWAYDTETRALFTSDVFAHTTVPDADGPRVIDSADDTVESVRQSLFAKYGWVATAKTDAILEDLERIFTELEIDIVAPAHGCVLRGDAVDEHYELLTTVLAGCGPRERVAS